MKKKKKAYLTKQRLKLADEQYLLNEEAECEAGRQSLYLIVFGAAFIVVLLIIKSIYF
jgi:hypothetical protein